MNNNTKIRALMQQIDSGKLKSDLCRILDYIIENGYTSRPMISDGLGIKLQTVVARVSELLDMGVIEVDRSLADDPELEYQILLHQPDPFFQARNMADRKKAKFNAWKKRGIKEFGDFLDISQLEFGFE